MVPSRRYRPIVHVVGIDLAWSDRNPSAGCALDGAGRVVDETPLRDDDEIVAWVTDIDAEVVAIDAPLLVPNETGMRPCERQIHAAYGSRGGGAHPANRTLLTRTSGRIRGEDLARRLEGFGGPWDDTARTLIEVYPHPGMIEVFGLPHRLRYKRIPAAERPGALGRLRDLLDLLAEEDPPLRGPRIDVPASTRGRGAKALEDRLDARFCAWVALVWALRPSRIRLFGDAATGHIAVPRLAGVDVTEATTADIDAIAAFLRAAWAEAGPDAAGWTGASDDVIDEITAPELIRARLGGPDRRMFIARDEGHVVGFAATRRLDPDTTELAGITLLESRTGEGIGSRLLEAAVASIDGAVLVRTETDNARAIAFYERQGFTRTGIVQETVEGIEVEVVELLRPRAESP
jgi:predicted RNase H-like nuclease